MVKDIFKLVVIIVIGLVMATYMDNYAKHHPNDASPIDTPQCGELNGYCPS